MTPSGGLTKSSDVVHSYVNEQIFWSLGLSPPGYVGYPLLGLDGAMSGSCTEASLSVHALGSEDVGGVLPGAG